MHLGLDSSKGLAFINKSPKVYLRCSIKFNLTNRAVSGYRSSKNEGKIDDFHHFKKKKGMVNTEDVVQLHPKQNNDAVSIFICSRWISSIILYRTSYLRNFINLHMKHQDATVLFLELLLRTL